MLGRTAGAVYVGEPDNHLRFPYALHAKACLPGWHFPAPADATGRTEAYELLWRSAFGERGTQPRRAGRVREAVAERLLASSGKEEIWTALARPDETSLRLRLAAALARPPKPGTRGEAVVVKSVYAVLALEWIVERVPASVVIVTRSPLNVLSSWAALDWLGRPGDDMLDTLDPTVRDRLAARYDAPPPATGTSVLLRATWLLAVLTRALRDAAAARPAWHVVSHESLCASSAAGFRSLAHEVGLRWDEASDRRVEDMNRPGGAFEPFRVSADLRDIWKTRLDAAQLADVVHGFERVGIDASSP